MTTELKEMIHKKRPNLSDSSVVTYTSILKNLYYRVFGSKEIEVKKFDETEPILDHLKGLQPAKRKTILSALVVITDDKKYRNLMLEDIRSYTNDINKQEKTESQKENWIEPNHITDLLGELKKTASFLYKKKELTNDDYQSIQNYIIICLLGGDYIPPRRALDYVNFKIQKVDKEHDNYLLKNELVFNSYKTAKCYGEQKVTCPPELLKILKKWISINPTDTLLFDTKRLQLSSVQLNQRLNKIFGATSGKSINQLRKSYLTNKFQSTIKENQEINQTMAAMGSSKSQLPTYVKKE